MKKLTLFLSLLMVMLLSVGQVWATDFTLSSAAEVTKDGITVTFAKGDGSNPPAWYSAGLRLYVKNTVTITSTSNITAISFNWEKQGSKTFNTSCTASTGSYTHPSSAGVGTWTGSATSVTFTLGNVSGAQLQLNTFSVTTEGGGSSDPTLTVEPATIDFGTVDQNAVVASKTVAVTFANLTGSVTYSGLSGAFSASGSISATGDEITIAANTSTVGEYKQTLTVTSADDSKSAEVTVKMNVVEPFDGLKLTFDVSSNPGEWPTTNDASLTNYTYALNAVDYTFALKNIKCNSGYLMMTATAVLGLPAIEGYKLEKVEATNSSSCSTTTQVKITSDEAGDEVVSGGAAQTFSTTSTKYTYTLSDTEENTMYYLIATNKNCQLVTLVLYYEEATPSTPKAVKPTFTGDETFLNSTSVSLSTTTEGASIYYTMGDAPDDPTTTSTLYEGPINVTATTTIKAIAVKAGMDNSPVAEATFTKATIMTVAEAKAAIDAAGSTPIENQYVTGIISQIDGYDGTHHSITYWISADGTTTDQLEVYSGKGLNGADFAGLSDLSLGDEVIVKGTLKNYKGTDEFDMNSQIIQLNRTIAAPTFTPDGGGFLTTLNVALASATEGAEVRYTVDGSDPISTSTLYENPIELSATTTIKAAAFKDEFVSVIVLRTFTKGTKITVAEALAALDSSSPIENQFVYGKVSTAPTSNPNSGRLTYKISDDGAAVDELEVYNGYGLNGAAFADKTDLQVGDEVTIYGTLKIYNEKKEFDGGNYLLEFNRPVIPTYSITYVENGANEDIEDVAAATNLPNPLPTVTKNEKVFGGWFTTSTFDGGTEAVAGAALSDDVILYAKWNDLSPWASVYTSNVTLSTEGGTSASAAKVKFYGEEGDGYDAIKAGTGSVQGAVVVNVPAGATALHFHAYGWNSESVGLTVTAPTGVTVSPATEISINSNSGIASNSPFTLAEGSDPKTDAYYAVSLSGNTEATNITISATSGKRFVLFGVNQEGGLVLESIAISGTASVLEYNDGDHFDPTGLVVTGHYSDDSEATISEGIDWTFDPDPLTEGTTSVSVTATVSEITSAAFPVNGLTVNGAAPLSPWASVYTSNVTLSTEGGTSASAAKVKFYGEEGDGYDAIKAGTGSVQGAVVVNVPAGATALHFHAYGWNSESVGLTVTAPTGVTVSPATEISINSNSGIASNSPFTLAEGSDPKTDAYYAVSLSGNTEATNITISATSGKRFVLFGVNQEGGVLPILESIEIAGDLTTKSYKAGDALDLDGLTVNAIYSLGGTPQTPVDITDDAELEWSYAPLVENQTSITITATYKGQTDDITINDLVVTSADPKIYVDPSLYVNFGSVDKDAALPADQTITVTLTNVAAGTATLAGADVFNIDKTALVEGENVITISVASTATAGEFSATITLTDNASAAPQKVVNLSFTVNEPVTPEDPEVRKTWDLSIASYDANPTEEQVTWSATYVNMVVDKYNATTKANNYLGGDANNRTSSRFYQNSKLTITPNGKEITSVVFTATSAGYANALQGSEWTNASASVDGTTVTVTPTDGKNAIIAVVGGTCGFTAVQVNYKNIAPEPPVVDYTEVRNGLNIGEFYTMCLDKAVTDVQGGTIWRVVSKAQNTSDIILEEVEGTLDAGRPYIFFATAGKLEVVYTGDAVGAPITEGNNGLVGSFTKKSITANESNYIIYDNELYYVNSGNVYVGDHRAYLNMAAVPAFNSGSAPAPGRRRISMAVHGEQVATGMEGVQPSEISNQKVLINGQLFILRGEKMYDATGRLVK